MVVNVHKSEIFNIFEVESFSLLELKIDQISPSLAEYHLENFIQNKECEKFFNKKDIQNSFCIGNFSLHLDYNENIYIELFKDNLDTSTQSFW